MLPAGGNSPGDPAVFPTMVPSVKHYTAVVGVSRPNKNSSGLGLEGSTINTVSGILATPLLVFPVCFKISSNLRPGGSTNNRSSGLTFHVVGAPCYLQPEHVLKQTGNTNNGA